MRNFIGFLLLSGIVLTTGCVVIPAQHAGIGFYGPFPAIYVEGHRGYSDRRGYDDRGDDHRHYDDDVYRDRRDRWHQQDH